MKTGLLLSLLCLLSTIAMPAQGQSNQFTPYERLYMVCYDPDENIFTNYGDICSWAEGETDVRQETSGKYIGDLVISPDGTKIAYLELPDEFVSAFIREEYPVYAASGFTINEDTTPESMWNAAYRWGQYSTNIGIMDLSTSQTMTVGEQDIPADADEWVYQKRYLPVWSPDSTQFAWLEYDLATESYDGRIIRYDTRTNSVEIVASHQSLGWADGGQTTTSDLLGWGSVIIYPNFNAGVYDQDVDSSFGQVLSFYDETGALSRTPISFFANFEDRFTGFELVLYQDEWRIAIHYPNLGWVLYDPLTDSYEQVDTIPYLQSITGGDWRGYLANTVPYPDQYEWETSETLPDDFNFSMPAAIDPKGIPIWSTENGLARFMAGEFQVLAFQDDTRLTIGQMVWMPIVWRIDGEATSIEKTVSP